MKTNLETEWKELLAVVCSILIYFGTLTVIVVSISLFYFLPMLVTVGGYLLVCALIALVVLAVDHRPHHHNPGPTVRAPLTPSRPEESRRNSPSSTTLLTH